MGARVGRGRLAAAPGWRRRREGGLASSFGRPGSRLRFQILPVRGGSRGRWWAPGQGWAAARCYGNEVDLERARAEHARQSPWLLTFGELEGERQPTDRVCTLGEWRELL